MLFLSAIRIIRSLRCLSTPSLRRILTGAGFALSVSGGAQSMAIDSLYFLDDNSDTLELNSFVSIRVFISNPDSAGQLGNLKIWFRNESNNFIELPLGGFENLQYFAPGQQRVLDIPDVPVTPQFFIEGGNTVVIWPSFVGEEIEPGPNGIIRELFIRNSNSVNELTDSPNKYTVPNPVYDVLYIQPFEKSPVPKELILRDLSGKIVLRQEYVKGGTMNVEMLASGIYILELRLPDGDRYQQRIVKSTR